MSFVQAGRSKVIFTIELELGLHQQTTQNAALLEDYTDLLLKLCAAYEMPVTWAVSDPAFSAAKDAILQSSTPHEIALLGDSTWVGATAGRARFARELARRVSAAAHLGIPIQSLVLRDAEPDDNLDLLRTHGICALRLAPQHSGREYSTVSRFAESLGIHVLPVTWLIGSHRSWWRGWNVGSEMMRETRAGYHMIALRGDQLIDDDRALRDITAVFELSAHRRERGEIEICTLSSANSPTLNTVAA